MLKLALGWLRWPPDQALSIDVNLILLAVDGDIQRAQAMNGTGQKGRPNPLDIREFAREHNMVRRRMMGE